MKKLALIFVLTFILTFTVTAEDGNTHTGGGKNCPPQQTCLIGEGDDGEIGHGTKVDGETGHGNIFETIFENMKFIFRF